MALLTSDNTSSGPLFTHVHKYGNWLSVLLYLAGIVTFAVFISEQWSEKTYFSDNALLPGLVNREFTLTSQSESLLLSLQQQVSKSAARLPHQRIADEFTQIGLESYQQNFSLYYPLNSKPTVTGSNVYAILRAPRAPSTEALLLSTTFSSDGSQNLPSISLIISLAKYFSLKNYWAKDIIFLVSDQALIGTQAWLNAYHDVRSDGVLEHEPLIGTSGPIQAAVNLELDSHLISLIDIKIEGLNGQLPNLDLFNVAVELSTRESLTPTLHQQSHPYAGPELDVWQQYATTVLSMMASQLMGSPSGAHGLFQKYAIQSITLQSSDRKSEKPVGASARLLQVGRVVEGIFRSLNNLLERFNRSYWFYLLPSTRRYLSIGYYMIPFALVTSPLLLTALRAYMALMCRHGKGQHNDQLSDQTKSDIQAQGHAALEDGIPFWFFAHLMGLVLVSLPFLVQQGVCLVSDASSPHTIVYVSVVSLSFLPILSPMLGSSSRNKLSQQVIGLLNAALLLSCISLINISLALSVSLLYSPVLCIVCQPSASHQIPPLLRRLLMLLVHPVTINFLALFSCSLYLHPEVSVWQHFLQTLDSQNTAVVSYVEHWYIYGHWLYPLSCGFLFPVWLQAWYST